MSAKRRKRRLGRLASAHRRDLFFALGEPTRRGLLELIAQGEQPFSRLTKFFPTSRQSVQDHLCILEKAGLVSVRFKGNRRNYRLRNAGLLKIRAWLTHYEELWGRGAKISVHGNRAAAKYATLK